MSIFITLQSFISTFARNHLVYNFLSFFLFLILNLFFYMNMRYNIIKNSTNYECLFVNTIPQHIHKNINPINTYTNTDVININLPTHTYIYMFMDTYKKKNPTPQFCIIFIPPSLLLFDSYKVDFLLFFCFCFRISPKVLYFLFCAIYF